MKWIVAPLFALLAGWQTVAADAVPYAIGDVTSHSAVVWSRLPAPGAATLTYQSRGEDPMNIRKDISPDDDLTALYELKRLKSGTRYSFTLRFAPARGAVRYVANGEFATAPPANVPAPVRLLWSGDLSGQNICRDADKGFPVFSAMMATRPDLFVAAGDMIYADERCEEEGRLGNRQVPLTDAPATDLAAFRSHWRYARADPQLRRFIAEVPYLPTWDDHELMDDFEPGDANSATTAGISADALLSIGRRAFLEHNPIQRDPGEPGRIYRDVRWGRHLHLFLLDTRQYRAPASAPDSGGEPKSMLGAAQREWLLATAGKSDATWRVIVSSVPLVIPTGPEHARDGWASGGGETGYSRELRAIIDQLRVSGAKNVLWLSADAHFASFFRHQVDEAYEVFEAVAGPLNALAVPSDALDTGLGTERLFKHPATARMTTFDAALGVFNFGVVDIDAAGQIQLRFVDARGETLWEVTLPARPQR
jgi:alkaline phosphatase D